MDELLQPGNGARRLVAKAFDHKANILSNEDLPSTSETYVHLLIASFMLTLTLSQKDSFSAILSLLIPSAIAIGKTGSSPLFSTGATRLPTTCQDIKHFYTDHHTSILKNIPAAITHTPRQGGSTYSFSSYYDCTQHFLAWGPPLIDFSDIISIENGPICTYDTRRLLIHIVCCLLTIVR